MVANRALRMQLYGVMEDTEQVRMGFDSLLSKRGSGWGRLAQITLLEVKLILRNKRSRQLLGVNLFLVTLFSLILATGTVEGTTGGGLLGLLISSFPAIMYHQFGYGWHGAHFDGLLTRTLSFRSIVMGRYTVFIILSTGPALGLFPILGGIQTTLLPGIAACCVYNLGVTGPVVLWIGQWNRQIVRLDQSTFFNPGTSLRTSMLGGLALYPTLGLPFVLLTGLNSPTNLLAVTGLGTIGLAASPLWLTSLARVLRTRRHDLTVGFQKGR